MPGVCQWTLQIEYFLALILAVGLVPIIIFESTLLEMNQLSILSLVFLGFKSTAAYLYDGYPEKGLNEALVKQFVSK